MPESIMLMRGTLSRDKVSIEDSNVELDVSVQNSISETIIQKIPSYIFEQNPEPRTIILEDSLGYNILKIFYKTSEIRYLLVRLEGKLYSSDEIRKISLKINQQLDIDLQFSNLWTVIQEIFIKIETYDFSRPIKARFYNIIPTEDDKALHIEEILPEMNQLEKSQDILDTLEYYKLQALLHYKKQQLGEPTQNFSQIYKSFIDFLNNYKGSELNQYDIASIIFNYALTLRDFKFYPESNDAFLNSSAKFRSLKITNLDIFSLFNLILNFKEMKKFDAALKFMLQNEEKIYESKVLSSGFKGIYFRHLGELYQLKKDYNSAKSYYIKSLNYFEKDKQINIDTALTYLALGTIDYNENDYFGASKYFSYAANIFNFLNQDITQITKNLGISFLNLSNEYLRTVKVLIIEREMERILDLTIRGLSYLFLASHHLGTQMLENYLQLSDSYSKLLERIILGDLELEEQEIAKRIDFILKAYYEQLTQTPDENTIKLTSKRNYEKLKEFQPLKTYYFMVIYKQNGIVIYSKTSTILQELPEFDENLVAGMISAIGSFLEEVLTGDENLSLIDRDNIKIILEYSENLIGLIFVNKENPKIRTDLRTVLSKIETEYKASFERWTGDISKFIKIPNYSLKLISWKNNPPISSDADKLFSIQGKKK